MDSENEHGVLRWSCGEEVKDQETYMEHVQNCTVHMRPSEGAIFLSTVLKVPVSVVQAALNVGGYEIVKKSS